jgi:DNA excision repair protein ERCC-3
LRTNWRLPIRYLNAGDDAVGLEQLEDDADKIALKSARRSQGSMSAMSGAKGMVYMEYRCDILFICMI